MRIVEPATLLLLATNLAVFLLLLRRRRAPRELAELRERLEALTIRVNETTLAAEAGSQGHRTGAQTLDTAIARAAAFLRQRLRSGAYGLACVGSDGAPRFSDSKGHVFVASFIVEAMAGLLDEIDRTIILTRILSEENERQWGFSPPGPHHDERFRIFHVDSDDTAYVLRTLRRLGVNRSPECLLRFYREPERLFVTFHASGPVSLATEGSHRSNLLAHPEVNANIYLALHGTHLEQFINLEMLRQAQDPGGFWPSYFYPSPLFATLLALELLDEKPGFAAETERARSFILDSQKANGSWGENGDPYETALALTALARHRDCAAAAQHGVDHLLATMVEDGSWASPACVWAFHADRSEVWRAYDRNRAYVSARCLTALRRFAGGAGPSS